MGSRREAGDGSLGNAKVWGKTSKWEWGLQMWAQDLLPTG